MLNENLLSNNYIFIPGFIKRERALILADQFKQHLLDTVAQADGLVPGCPVYRNWEPAFEIMAEKKDLVSELAGSEVCRSFAYGRWYKKGSKLPRHKDKRDTDISLSVHLNGDREWAFNIKTPEDTELAIILEPGDAVLYRGWVTEHWREPYEGTEYLQMFLHYIRKEVATKPMPNIIQSILTIGDNVDYAKYKQTGTQE